MSEKSNEFDFFPEMSKFPQYLEYIQSLISKEELAEKDEFELLFKKSSKKLKRESGLLWSSVSIVDVNFFGNNQIELKIKRTDDSIKSAFQVGQNVRLFRDSERNTEEVIGILTKISHSEAVIVFTAEDTPDWMDDNFSLETSYSDITYKAMNYSIQELLNSKNKKVSQFKDEMFSEKIYESELENKNIKSPILNETQNIILNLIINSNNFFLVHGPPGTGKTTLITETIKELINLNEKILICASSNLAVDLLTEKCILANLNIVRLGNPVRISSSIQDVTLEKKILNHEYYTEIKKYKKEADEKIKKARTYKRNFGKKEYNERKELLKEAKELYSLSRKTQDIIINDIFDKSSVVASTLSGLYISKYLKNNEFDSIFIDEASQAIEPLCYLPILLAPKNRIVFVGDPMQLPPTIFSSKKSNEGLRLTFFEKLLYKFKNKTSKSQFLNIQYRMNSQIVGFPNQYYYDNKLLTDISNKDKSLNIDKIDNNTHIIFVDTAGTDFYENKEESESISNIEEAKLLINILNKYYINSENINNFTIGILSPYKAQINLIENLLKDLNLNFNLIETNTIDSFQGREKDFIILSLARSNMNMEIGFLEDTRRLNVALTRAKKELIIIGDSETIQINYYYKKLISYITEIGGFHSAWEFIES
jgi:ATP-dependent RNA/DNA helicase IGHMBP2